MKLTNLSILFFSIFLCYMVIADQKIQVTEEIRKRQSIYNNAIDNATQDALVSAVELADGRTLSFHKDKLLDVFYRSLSISLTDDQGENGIQKIKNYIPIMAMIEENGFYIYYGDLNEQQGDKIKVGRFTKKIPYRYETEEYVYYFTLSDYIRLEDKRYGEEIEGDFHDVRIVYPNSILSKESEYERIKRDCIIGLLTEEMNYYMNRYNKVASQIGIQYTFALPNIEKEEWYQMVKQVSLLAFFQGYPYGSKSLGYYNRYALGIAKIEKGRYYYLQKDMDNGKLKYHRENCELLYDRSHPFISRRECVREGASLCEKCS